MSAPGLGSSGSLHNGAHRANSTVRLSGNRLQDDHRCLTVWPADTRRYYASTNPTIRLFVMPLLRRSFAALSGLFLLQLMLLGSGTLCAMHHGLARAGVPNHAMAMSGLAHQTRAHESLVTKAGESNTPMSPVDCGGSGGHDDCRLPFAPGPCSSATTCDVSATPAAAIGASAYVHVVALELPSPALGHSGPTFAPELPPPRA